MKKSLTSRKQSAMSCWQHRVKWENAHQMLLNKRLAIGFGIVAADQGACDALNRRDFKAYCRRYKAVNGSNIPKSKNTIWDFIVKMKVGDFVVVPCPNGFNIYRVTSDPVNLNGTVGDLGWYRNVDEIVLGCSPRVKYATGKFLSKMNYRRTLIDITDHVNDIRNAVMRRKNGGNSFASRVKNIRIRRRKFRWHR